MYTFFEILLGHLRTQIGALCLCSSLSSTAADFARPRPKDLVEEERSDIVGFEVVTVTVMDLLRVETVIH